MKLEFIWDKPGPTGKGGTTTTGDIGRDLLHVHKDVVIAVLPKQHKALFEKWGQMLSVIIQMVSSKGKVSR